MPKDNEQRQYAIKLLYSNWLQSRSPDTNNNDYSVLSDFDANVLNNSFSPYDLYNKPTAAPLEGNLPQVGFNVQNVGAGVPNASVVYKENDFSKQGNDAIASHEAVHARQLPTDRGNRGFTTYAGMEGTKGLKEQPAMAAEDRYWQIKSYLNSMQNGKGK